MKTIFLYGIGGTSDCYRVIQYIRIDQQDFSILTLRYEAQYDENKVSERGTCICDRQ